MFHSGNQNKQEKFDKGFEIFYPWFLVITQNYRILALALGSNICINSCGPLFVPNEWNYATRLVKRHPFSFFVTLSLYSMCLVSQHLSNCLNRSIFSLLEGQPGHQSLHGPHRGGWTGTCPERP